MDDEPRPRATGAQQQLTLQAGVGFRLRKPEVCFAGIGMRDSRSGEIVGTVQVSWRLLRQSKGAMRDVPLRRLMATIFRQDADNRHDHTRRQAMNLCAASPY